MRFYVEGGGKGNALRTACRRAFSTLLARAGINRLPRIIASGSRSQAYSDFCTALAHAESGEFVGLLVDSEDPVPNDIAPWAFLAARPADQWTTPPGAADENVHLMVQCMETWLVADQEALERYFGRGFRRNALPNRADVENIPKREILAALEGATRDCNPKGQYRKERHSFEVLRIVDPERVQDVSPHARRLFQTLRRISDR